MDITAKQEHIIRCVKLGMSTYESMIVSECTDEEIKTLEEDEQFQSKIKFHQCIEEKALLEKFNKAMEDQLRMGNTKAVEKKLAKINPKRWDDKRVEPPTGPAGLISNVNISLNGIYPGVEK